MTAAEAPEIIRIEGLVKRFGNVVALDGVSLAVRRGEFLALLGPSGCGKTTLLRTIAGLIEPSAGTVWIDGMPMTGIPPNHRPVNTVFQNYALFPHLSVAENVAFGPKRRRVPSAEIPQLVADALVTVGMKGYGDRYPAELSGGQQQRIALARAIVNQPKVLLLDEPLGALDLKLRKRMQIELKHLQAKLGITFVHVTHDQEEALVIADRIAVMAEGRVVQIGSGEEVYRRPNSRYVADFVGEANLLACAVEAGGRLRLENGRASLPYAAEAGAAKSAVLLVRPESIDLGPGPAGVETVTLQATVRETVFAGSTIRLYAEIDGGVEIVFEPSSMEAAERLKKGARVTIHWRRDQGRVLAG